MDLCRGERRISNRLYYRKSEGSGRNRECKDRRKSRFGSHATGN